MTYALSPSALNLLKDCPRCFWLSSNHHIKRPSGPFPSLPSGMDKVLKTHFDVFREKGELPPELVREGINVALFNDLELLSVWRNSRKGIRWTDAKGNTIYGAIDNLLQKEKKLIVLDYKTRGYPLKEDTAVHYQDQLDIYNFLFRKNGYETEDYSYLLFYHPKEVNEKGYVLFNTNLVKLDVNIKNVETIIKNALGVLEGDLPKSSEKCEFCTWKTR